MKYDVILFTGMTGKSWHVKPLGAYRVATELRKNGYTVKVLDWANRWLSDPVLLKPLLEQLIGDNTLFVGFSATFFGEDTQMPAKEDIATWHDLNGTLSSWPCTQEHADRFLKYLNIQYPHVKTVYGGVDQLERLAELSSPVNFIVRGLADVTVIDLANHLRHGTRLKSLNYHNSGALIIDYDTKAYGFDFAHSKVEYTEADHIFPDEILPLETSRGCLFKCSFCDFPLIGRKKGDPEYHKDVASMAEELRANFADHGVNRYMIVDDTFNETTAKLEDLLRARDLSKVDIQFSSYLRSDLLIRFPEQITLLKELGLTTAFFGIESLYRPSAMAIGKSTHPSQIKELLYTIKSNWANNELKILGSFIIGLPEDNPATLETWVPWLDEKDNPIDMIQMYPLMMMDNSEISRNPEKFGYKIKQFNNIGWENKLGWTSVEAYNYVNECFARYWKNSRLRIAGWDYMGYQNLGLDKDLLNNTTLDQLDYSMLADKEEELWNRYKNACLAYEFN